MSYVALYFLIGLALFIRAAWWYRRVNLSVNIIGLLALSVIWPVFFLAAWCDEGGKR